MNENLKNSQNFRFHNLLYLNFIILKKDNVDECAKNWWPHPIHRDTLYRKIRGANPFTVDDLPGLTKSTKRQEYLEFIANQCGFSIIPVVKDKQAIKLMNQIADILQRATNGKEEK
jgi:hypothetical protein